MYHSFWDTLYSGSEHATDQKSLYFEMKFSNFPFRFFPSLHPLTGLVSKVAPTYEHNTTNDDSNSDDHPSTQGALLGEIELSLDTTLDDLKTRVLTLPSMGKVSLPTTEFLRVRMKEGEKLTRILKDGGLTLRFVILNICLLVSLNPVSPYLV